MNVAILVRADSPFRKFEDLIAYARQNPKKLTVGSAGVGTAGNVFVEQIAKKEGVVLTHIPFKGGTEAQTALLGGHIRAHRQKRICYSKAYLRRRTLG